MTRDELARLFRVTAGTVIRWARDGMPVAKGGGQGRQAGYLPSHCVAWRLAQLEARRTEGALSLESERAGLAKVQRERIEMQNRVRGGELLEVAAVEQTVGEMLQVVKSHLLALPTALAPECARLAQQEGPVAVFRCLTAALHDALRELARWRPDGPQPAAGSPAETAPSRHDTDTPTRRRPRRRERKPA